MSSSSALMIAVFLVLADVNRLESLDLYRCTIRTREDLAGYLATIENGQTFGGLEGDAGVGTFGGSEDHTAILDSQPGTLGQYSYCPVKKELCVQLPKSMVFAAGLPGLASRGVDHPARSVGGVQLVSRRALHQAEQPGLGDVGDAGGPVLRHQICVQLADAHAHHRPTSPRW